MSERFEKVKDHLKENKTVYLVGVGSAVVGAAVTVLAIARAGSSADIQQKHIQIGIGNRMNAAVINLVEHSTASKPVHLVGSDRYFSSLSEAARQTGHSVSTLSRHVNGHIPDVKGDIFELLNLEA